MIWRALIGRLWRPLAWLFGALGLWLAGRRSASQAAKIDTLQAEAEAHDRINEADLGLGATDQQRIDRLHEFAAKHRN